MTKDTEDYGDWLIWYDPLPIRWRGADWHFSRKEIRDECDIGFAESREMCLQAIDWREEQDSPEEQARRDEESTIYINKIFNADLIRQMGLGLNAARSMIASGGRGFADGINRQLLDKAWEAFNEWNSDHQKPDPKPEPSST